MTIRFMLLSSICTSMLFTAPAFAQGAGVNLQPIIVTSDEDNEEGGTSLTVPGNAQAEALIQQTPGGVAVVAAESYEDTFALNFADTLDYVPGVYAQKRYGEEVRLSIRGSGLSRGFHLRGLALLQDGVPFNLADGSADFQEADMLALQRLEVFKGANALQYGGTTLGGAVNMVSKTGRSNPGKQVRGEWGSDNTYRTQVQQGEVDGSSDMFLSLTGLSSDGYRAHDDQQSAKFNANYGKELADDVETRFFFSTNIIEQDLPGTLGREEALNTPTAANALAISRDQARDIRSVRLSNKTTFDLGGGELVDVGVFTSLKDLYHPLSFGVVDQESIDYGAYTQRSGTVNLGGFDNRYRAGFNTHAGQVNAKTYANINGSRGALTGAADQSSLNALLYGENNFYMLPEWALVTGGQLSWSERDVNNKLDPAKTDTKIYSSFNPKLGLLYEPAEALQFFANISRSYETPTFSELTQTGTGFTPLDGQKAWTAEIGSRGSAGAYAWDAALYRAWVKDEMLQFTTGPGIPASTFNAGDTIHQGFELGLDIRLAEHVLAKDDHLQWRNAYTYSNFYFVNDAQYGDNEIAGQPPHYYQTELRYDHPDGWYVAPNVEWASGADVDFANELDTPGYALLGMGAGYDVSERVSLFFDARNLTDENYIATFSTITDVSLVSNSVFYPGEGRRLFAGVKVTF